MAVGQAAVIEDLQERVEHVGMRLFDLVEEHHGVGLAADLLRELAGLVIAHVARGRAHEAGDGVGLHKFGHIQPDQRFRRIKQFFGKRLAQLGFSNAGRPDKNERGRPSPRADVGSAAPDRGRNLFHRFVLPDDTLPKNLFQTTQPLHLAAADLFRRDSGPERQHLCQIILGHGCSDCLRAQRFSLLL